MKVFLDYNYFEDETLFIKVADEGSRKTIGPLGHEVDIPEDVVAAIDHAFDLYNTAQKYLNGLYEKLEGGE
jgi:hypothetical protein